MFSFLHNLTTSKKQQQLQASNGSKQISDTALFGVSKSSKIAIKSKLKNDTEKEENGIICKASPVNGKNKKKSSSKTKFFLRKSRWVFFWFCWCKIEFSKVSDLVSIKCKNPTQWIYAVAQSDSLNLFPIQIIVFLEL